MNYFTNLLSSQAHSLRLPVSSRDDVERYVMQHQKGAVSAERAPFRRQVDFWAFSIAVALASGMPPLREGSSTWGRKFADTRSVEMPDGICEMIAVVALGQLGADHEGLDDPKEIIEFANCLAGAGCPRVLEQLGNPNLRLTTLEKALAFAASLRPKTIGTS